MTSPDHRLTRSLFRCMVGAILFVLCGSALAGHVASARRQDQLTQRDLVLERPSRRFALVIGVAEYQHLDASRQLQFPESDARAMRDVLISREAGSFPSENVHLLTGRTATLDNIRRELNEWLVRVAQPQDFVVVYFAGHGIVKGGRGYIAPWDVDPERIDATGYPMDELGDLIANRIKARWKILLTDACHSGKVKFNAETSNEAVDGRLANLPSRFLSLAATTDLEQSYEDRGLASGFGLFTYFVMQGWKGNADTSPCDGKITAEELVWYVQIHVRRHSGTRQLSQTPTAVNETGIAARGDHDPGMVVGIGPGCVDGNPAPSMMTGAATVESNMDRVRLYIDGRFISEMSKDESFSVPGLSAGRHEFKAEKEGYEPDRKEITIIPGQDVTVTLRLKYVRQIKKSALDTNAEGERLLYSHRSTINPLNLVPVRRSQNAGDLTRARDKFVRALADDSGFSEAAVNLGQVSQLLGDNDASRHAYERALKIEPGHIQAKTLYAKVLIESGDADEAVRQLLESQRLDPDNDEVYATLARAYWDKENWKLVVEYADLAIARNPSNQLAYLWKADALRQSKMYADASANYRTFLRLTNYSSPVHERLLFFLGHGLGSRRHADREGAYKSLRSAGNLGLCITEQKTGRVRSARAYCERAIGYDRNDPIAHFLLGITNLNLYQEEQVCDYLAAGRTSLRRMIALNPHLEESKQAQLQLNAIQNITCGHTKLELEPTESSVVVRPEGKPCVKESSRGRQKSLARRPWERVRPFVRSV